MKKAHLALVRLGPLSPLGWLNFLVLQWFTLRVTAAADKDRTVITRWGMLFGIIPLTGWWSPFIFFDDWGL